MNNERLNIEGHRLADLIIIQYGDFLKDVQRLIDAFGEVRAVDLIKDSITKAKEIGTEEMWEEFKKED